jgi:hypothetical protein
LPEPRKVPIFAALLKTSASPGAEEHMEKQARAIAYCADREAVLYRLSEPIDWQCANTAVRMRTSTVGLHRDGRYLYLYRITESGALNAKYYATFFGHASAEDYLRSVGFTPADPDDIAGAVERHKGARQAALENRRLTYDHASAMIYENPSVAIASEALRRAQAYLDAAIALENGTGLTSVPLVHDDTI